MSSCDGEDKRKIPVRSIFLRPDQYRKHWDEITPTKRSAHIRDRIDKADQYDVVVKRILDQFDRGGDSLEDCIQELRHVFEEAEHESR